MTGLSFFLFGKGAQRAVSLFLFAKGGFYAMRSSIIFPEKEEAYGGNRVSRHIGDFPSS